MQESVPQYIGVAAKVCTGLPLKYAKKVLRDLGWDVKKKLAVRSRWVIALQTKNKKVVHVAPTASPRDMLQALYCSRTGRSIQERIEKWDA